MNNQTSENDISQDNSSNSYENINVVYSDEFYEPVKKPESGMARAAMICGIVAGSISIGFCFGFWIPIIGQLLSCFIPLSFPTAIVAIVLSLVDRHKNSGFSKFTKIGLILGILTLVAPFVFLLFYSLFAILLGFSSFIFTALAESM